jgi:FkbH-like protein
MKVENTPGNIDLEVGLCASFVVEPLQDYLHYWTNELEVKLKLNVAPYNQVFQQLLNKDSLLNQTNGLKILLIDVADWIRDRDDLTPAEQCVFIKETYDGFVKAIGYAQSTNTHPFLIGLVSSPAAGELTVVTSDCILETTKELKEFFEKGSSFYLLDLFQIASLYEVDEIWDPKSAELGHLPFTQEYYAALGTYLVRKVLAYNRPAYKVIALDCDNTLWKGICGEDGSLNVGIGEGYSDLQDFLLKRHSEGFLLVLCSKNNENDVWEVFDKHPGMKLKREHIAAHRINWDPKAGNLMSLAKELNLGLDSFIFLDDSNFEIEQVSANCPEIYSVTIPEDASGLKSFIDHIWAFDIFGVTDEDRQRNSMYKAERLRNEEKVNFGYLEDFLQSLNIEIHLSSLDESDFDRALQLSLRTNQFNLNGIRQSRESIASAVHSPSALNWIVEVKDRFGNYGKVGLLMAHTDNDSLLIDTFLLSCRVLGRNVEDHILAELQAYCSKHHLHNLVALYKPTAKNQPFLEFLKRTEWINDPQTDTYSYLLNQTKKTLTVENEI